MLMFAYGTSNAVTNTIQLQKQTNHEFIISIRNPAISATSI